MEHINFSLKNAIVMALFVRRRDAPSSPHSPDNEQGARSNEKVKRYNDGTYWYLTESIIKTQHTSLSQCKSFWNTQIFSTASFILVLSLFLVLLLGYFYIFHHSNPGFSIISLKIPSSCVLVPMLVLVM